MPYVLLVSFIIAVTNISPFFGAVPSVIIILFESPTRPSGSLSLQRWLAQGKELIFHTTKCPFLSATVIVASNPELN